MKKQLILVIAILFFVTGCYETNGKEAQKQGVKYLEEKYNTTCEFVKVYGGNDSMKGDYSFHVKCDIPNGDDILVDTHDFHNKEYKFTFTDNYSN